jgi:mannose-6-phosphate isomerase-like protein (cupin superfamily)
VVILPHCANPPGLDFREGQVVNLEGEDFTLGEGDSMYFDCTHPHSYRRKGSSPCAAVVVVTA